LQHLGRRLAQATLDLGEVRVGHAGLFGQLSQRQPRTEPLFPEIVTERLDGLPDLALCHDSIVLTSVSKRKQNLSDPVHKTLETPYFTGVSDC
jgi:hypothetical protein